MSKKAATEKKPEVGICFPADKTGGRSTTIAGKNILSAAMRGVKGGKAEEYAASCDKEKNWRFKYNKHLMNMVKLSAASPENALAVANAGVNFMHSNFEFIEKDTGDKRVFSEYMANASSKGTFHTGTIVGTGAKGGKPLVVPYKGNDLSGATLKKQLQAWSLYGTMEPDAAMTISSMATGNLDLSGKNFVLIGAGSAMGPFTKLLEHGATVICIDIPGAWGERPAAMWQRIFDTARKSSGRILFPLSVPQDQCAGDAAIFAKIGCNLTEQPAQILNWLKSILPGEAITVGNYTYLDGDMHVKLSLAADGILKGLTETPERKASIAFLCTPTDIHATTDPAYAAAQSNYGYHPGRLLEGLVQVLSMGKLLQKNALPPVKCEDGSTLKLVDGLSVAQGPNYALAKRLQHWRAMIAYSQGVVVSSHIAPSTATISVVSNRTFGWAYGGMPYFKPYEIFQQDTTNALMAAILAANVTLKDAKGNPASSKSNIKNTLEIFKHNSVHGGMWRAGYKADSIGEMSVIIHFLGGPKLFLPVVTLLLIGIVAVVLKALGKF